MLALVATFPVLLAAQTNYRVVTLPGLGGAFGYANSINNRGWASGGVRRRDAVSHVLGGEHQSLFQVEGTRQSHQKGRTDAVDIGAVETGWLGPDGDSRLWSRLRLSRLVSACNTRGASAGKPTLESLRGAMLWRVESPGTCSPSREKVWKVMLDETTYRQWTRTVPKFVRGTF